MIEPPTVKQMRLWKRRVATLAKRIVVLSEDMGEANATADAIGETGKAFSALDALDRQLDLDIRAEKARPGSKDQTRKRGLASVSPEKRAEIQQMAKIAHANKKTLTAANNGVG